MNISAFKDYMGKKLSVATTKSKENGTPESYIGFLKHIGEDYIVLDYGKASTNSQKGIALVILSSDVIVGVWIYN